MNDIIEHLLRFLTLNPNLGLLMSAALTSTAVVCVAWALALQLQRRSARARVLVWRITVVTLLLVAGWRLMPDFSPPVAVVEWQVPMPAARIDLSARPVEMPALVIPEKTEWQRGAAMLEHFK